MMRLLNCGFYNYVTTSAVVALIDCRIEAAKKLKKSVRAEKPRSIIDLTRGRKELTLIVLTGDRYIISAISRKQLAKRMGLTDEQADDLKPLPNNRLLAIEILNESSSEPEEREAPESDN